MSEIRKNPKFRVPNSETGRGWLRLAGYEVLSDAGFRTSDFHLFRILAQFDVPIGQVNEMLPTVVPVQAEIDLHKRTPFRALGLADEVHAGFLRLAVGFLRIAFDAGTNNVFARELYFLLWQPVINEQQNDSRHADAEGNSADGFLLRRVFGNVAPFLKIEGVERAVLGVDDDLRLALKQQYERAAGGADV